VIYISATPDQGSCSEAGGVVTCNLGDIANGGGVSVTIVVSTTSADTLTNTASVSSATDDPNTANNSDDEETTVAPIGPPDEIIIDNQDPEFSTVGTWRTRNWSIYNAYNGDFQFTSAGDGSRQAIFTPNIITAGDYEVFIWFVTSNLGATNTPHTVNYNGGSTTIEIDQRAAPSEGGYWFSLGVYNFSVGTSGSIVVSDNADWLVLADAVRLVGN
jgi:hypothetical protein